MDNIDLDIQFHTRDEAQELYGFVLYQGGIVPGKMIRVVKVPKSTKPKGFRMVLKGLISQQVLLQSIQCNMIMNC